MKYTLPLIILVFSCQPKKTLTQAELDLIKSIEFETTVVEEIKNAVDTDIVQYEISDPGYEINNEGISQKTGVQKKNGLSFKVDPNETDRVIFRLKDDFVKKGYLIYVSESGYESPSTVSIIRSENQFDILRLEATDGINYDIENKDVIEKLEEWDSKYGIQIIGADYDWVEFILKKTPDNTATFSQEVYDFCPDAVDQGLGKLSELERVIRETKRIYLWWD